MSKPTVQSVHASLSEHEKICAERWKTCFKQLEQLNSDITFIRNWIIGGIGTIALAFLGFILSTI
jgi:hypothetical protein